MIESFDSMSRITHILIPNESNDILIPNILFPVVNVLVQDVINLLYYEH